MYGSILFVVVVVVVVVVPLERSTYQSRFRPLLSTRKKQKTRFGRTSFSDCQTCTRNVSFCFFRSCCRGIVCVCVSENTHPLIFCLPNTTVYSDFFTTNNSLHEIENFEFATILLQWWTKMRHDDVDDCRYFSLWVSCVCYSPFPLVLLALFTSSAPPTIRYDPGRGQHSDQPCKNNQETQRGVFHNHFHSPVHNARRWRLAGTYSRT